MRRSIIHVTLAGLTVVGGVLAIGVALGPFGMLAAGIFLGLLWKAS